MAEGFNQVIVAGNLGADAELRFSQGGTGVLSFKVAATERYKDKGGEWKESTEWIPCVLFGARAEPLSKILRKGSSVTVVGKFKTESYEKDGRKHYSTKVYVNQVILGGRGQAQDGQQDNRRGARTPNVQPPANDAGDSFGYHSGDDVPF